MAIRTPAASPSQAWGSASGAAQVHGLAQVLGQVLVEPGATLAAGAVVQADPNATVRLGAASTLQEGATVYGRAQGRVLGDDRNAYAVWVGDRTTLTHKVLVQSPVYIGADCFIGFRSTLFNARLGAGCVVMMHALVQDVDVPPGKLVPSGSVITQQHQADALSDVGPADIALVRELAGMAYQGFPPGGSSGGHGAASLDFSGATASSGATAQSNERDGLGTMTSQLLPPDVVQRARQYLAQGLTIGTEHANPRRYRSGVWQTCSPIQSHREPEVLAALEACLSEHSGEYVRMFGIDPKVKQRVAPITIQRADGKPVEASSGFTVSSPSSSSFSSNGNGAYRPAGPVAAGPLSSEVVQQVRQYLSQGYRIGTEHADARRYSSNVWQTCSPISSSREGEVFGDLERCLAEHSGEYVRLFGIDPKAKRRVAPITIQRPDGRPTVASSGSGYAPSAAYSAAPSSGGGAPQAASSDTVQQVRQWLSQGYHIGAEHADSRRYSSNVWQTCTPITGTREGDVIAALNTCIAEHPSEYVRMFGIDPKAKRRVAAVTIQRPGSKAAPAASAPAYSAPAPGDHRPSSGAAPRLSQDVVQQVNQLVNQGYRLSLEHADVRRYRSGAWQNGGALEGSRASEVLAALESQLRGHSGKYVRLIGIDPKAKKRVLEATIQRP